MMAPKRLPSKLVVSGIALLALLLTMPRLLSAAYLNAASHELILSTSDAPILSPYALSVRDLAHARNAIMLAERGRSLNPGAEQFTCMRLRAEISAMDWQAAWATARENKCSDVALRVRRAPWEAIQVVQYLQQGDLEAARVQFHRTLAEGGGLFSASFESLLKPGLDHNSQSFAPELQKDSPRLLVGQTVAHDWRPMPQPVSASWALVGYDLDESALESGEIVDAALYWQPLRTDVVPGADWVQAGTLWRQDVRLANLVPDTGFEWNAEGVNAWQVPSGAAQVVETERAGRTTHALQILPNPVGGGAIAATPVQPIGSACSYLMGGWVRSQGAAPTFSIVWDGAKNEPNDPGFINLMEGPRDVDWTHISALVESKAGARGVQVFASNWAAVWLQELHPPRAMMVDNVFLIPVSLPDAPPCSLYGHEVSKSK